MTDPRMLAVDAAALDLAPLPLPEEDVLDGSPVASSVALGELGDVEVGLWELTAGTVRDTEVDEIFVVLSGDATVRFADGTRVEIGPGSVVRLHAGEQTEWEIRETVRKVYIATE